MPNKVKSLPLRKSDDGKWEVEMRASKWLKCETKADAEILSNAPKVRSELDETKLPNEIIATKLEKIAKKLEQYKMRADARYFRAMAKLARRKQDGRK